MLRVPWLTVGFFCALLSGCVRPDAVPFQSSPRIFRGVYEAALDTRASSSDIAWSADGEALAMATGDGVSAVQLWDLGTGEATGVLGESLWGHAAVMTPAGDRVALIVYPTDYASNVHGRIHIWDTVTEKLIHRLPGRTKACSGCEPSALALSPDGSLLALTSTGDVYTEAEPYMYTIGELSVFDMASGDRLLTFSGLQGEEIKPYFSRDGTRLGVLSRIYSEGQTRAVVHLWDVPSGTSIGTYEHVTPEGYLDAEGWLEGPVVALFAPGRIELRDVVSGELVRSLVRPLGEDESVEQVRLSTDLEKALVSYVDRSNLNRAVTRNILWEGTEQKASVDSDAYELAVGFSPADTFALTWSDAGLVLRDAETLKSEKVFVTGEVIPLRLEATPSYGSPTTYDVQGNLTFEGAEPVAFSGSVDGGDEERYVRWSYRTTTLEFGFTYEGAEWYFYGHPGYGGNGYGWLGDLSTRPESRSFDVELERVEN